MRRTGDATLSACAVIVSYRTGPALAACLASVGKAEGLDEIVLVDNGNEASEAAALDAFAADPRVTLLRGQGNVGFAAACNLGAARAASDVLAFINPDVVLAPDAIPVLEAAIAAAPPPAIVGGDLRDAENQPERGSRRDRLTLWRAFVSFSGLSRLERAMPLFRDFNRHGDPLPNGPVTVGAVSGAMLAMQRADFLALGGFDEGYFVHVEDLDICRRAEAASWRVLFVPGPHGTHLRSTSAAPAGEVAWHKARGMARYMRKFAANPIERVIAEVAAWFLLAAGALGRGRR
jgi:N-acetylglucosaminyl-diphospho-decaprenol L-rhamnosyltransferase